MCGRYTLVAELPLLLERFDLEPPDFEVAPRYNIAPTQDVLAVLNEAPRRLARVRWGLIPFWAKEASIGNRMINARAETLSEKPSFRKPLQSQRCLILADGFYEWRKDNGKTPVRVTLRDEEPFALAGLWDTWKNPESGETLRTCTIITTEPNALLGAIHNRMPVILEQEAEAAWLDTSLTDARELMSFVRPYPAEGMRAYPVSKLVNSPANDAPACIEPAEHR